MCSFIAVTGSNVQLFIHPTIRCKIIYCTLPLGGRASIVIGTRHTQGPTPHMPTRHRPRPRSAGSGLAAHTRARVSHGLGSCLGGTGWGPGATDAAAVLSGAAATAFGRPDSPAEPCRPCRAVQAAVLASSSMEPFRDLPA